MRNLKRNCLIALLVTIVWCVVGVWAQDRARTSENNKALKKLLDRFPEADTDRDGVLTYKEALAFRQQKRGKDGVRPPTTHPDFEKKVFKGKEGKVLNYWLLQPKAADPKKKYPLVLALHGRGGNTYAPTVLGTDSMRKKYPCFVMAPQAPKPSVWSIPQGFRKLRGQHTLPLVFEALEALQKEAAIDPDRIYVTGQSMGGFGSFAAIVARPKLFAAAAPICGGWVAKDARKIAHIPIWAFHGANDKTVPPKWSREMIEAIKDAGGSPKYTEYPGVGHGSWVMTYKNPKMWEWMFAQKRKK